jgi:hypothetical protein
MNTLAIMQPYFFPYIGYFQLMKAVDTFVIYDNIEYTKKGWINRNRILLNDKETYISLPLKKDSDFLNVTDREISEEWNKQKKKTISQIEEAYRKAPYFKEVFPFVIDCLNFNEKNLFLFIENSVRMIATYLNIDTNIIKSSSILGNEEFKGQDKVLKICELQKANTYINAIGGQELYSKEEFKEKGIDLFFIKQKDISYNQFNDNKISYLSIIDVLMFNSKEERQILLNQYELI